MKNKHNIFPKLKHKTENELESFSLKWFELVHQEKGKKARTRTNVYFTDCSIVEWSYKMCLPIQILLEKNHVHIKSAQNHHMSATFSPQ